MTDHELAEMRARYAEDANTSDPCEHLNTHEDARELVAEVDRLRAELAVSMPTEVAQRACELTCYVTRQWAAKAGYERPCTILAEEGKHVIPLRRFTDGPDTRIWGELIRDAFFMAQAEHDSAQAEHTR